MRISDWSSDVCSSDLANGDPARFAAFGLPVATDAVEGYACPLAGVLTGMEWAAANAPGAAWVASFACDTPFFPEDMVRSEEHTSELQSLMRISYAVFCLNKKTTTTRTT